MSTRFAPGVHARVLFLPSFNNDGTFRHNDDGTLHTEGKIDSYTAIELREQQVVQTAGSVVAAMNQESNGESNRGECVTSLLKKWGKQRTVDSVTAATNQESERELETGSGWGKRLETLLGEWEKDDPSYLQHVEVAFPDFDEPQTTTPNPPSVPTRTERRNREGTSTASKHSLSSNSRINSVPFPVPSCPSNCGTPSLVVATEALKMSSHSDPTQSFRSTVTTPRALCRPSTGGLNGSLM